MLPFGEVLLVREGDAVRALQLVVALLAQPQGRRGLRDGEGLDLARVGEMRTSAQVDEGPARVRRRHAAVGQLGADHRQLEGVVGKELQRVLLGDDHALERLLLVADLGHLLLHVGAHLRLEGVAPKEGIIEEARIGRGAVRQLRRVERLESLAEDVRRRVPEDVLALGLVELVQLELAITLERPHRIPQLPFHCGGADGGLVLRAIGVDDRGPGAGVSL
mmetsp:Transcript_11960/g.27695  ORF Transcript_11960/g.27695 Transcript_11960/m.27695 type:complete len:220 (-) Transcript_11960:452-1111(-)